MKKIYLSLFFACSVFLGHAQDEKTKVADQYFSKYEFVNAAKEYQKLVRGVKTDNYINLQLAESYYNIFNTVEAAKYYGKAIEANPKLDAEIYYKYAQMLKASGRYDTANDVMRKFARLAPSDQRTIAFQRDPDYIPKLRSQEELFTFEDSGINIPDGSDFGAFLSQNDTLYFTSTRTENKKTYGWNNQPFLDLFQAKFDPQSQVFSEIKAISEVNTKYHDGPATVSADGKTMFFATESFREGNFVKNKAKLLKLGKVSLFKATKKGKKWGDFEAFPYNGKDYSVSNPSLSKDGKTLYFASDMPGTLGGMDIWKVTINEDGTYTEPQNLGSRVNTEGRESFPFISDDNKLYFASDSRKGFGGLDIYVLDLEIKDAELKNLGAPINTAKDDFAFTFYPDKNVGFFSTNRVGRDDIYKAIPVCNVEMYVTVINEKTGEILSGAQVKILDDRKNIIEVKYSDARGLVEYVVECRQGFVLQVDKNGFEGKIVNLPPHKGGRQQVTVALKPIEVIVVDEQVLLGDVFFEFNKTNITQQGSFELNKLVQVMERNPNMRIKIEAHTDSRGSDEYNLKLSERRAQTTLQYMLSMGISPDRLESQGYGESQPRVKCGDHCTEEQHALNRRSEFIILQK
ncbi:OmpA family protein [Flavobacterium sp. HSC-61S13]|uniref:OmpA family protein n=1 Tax=Flavobacterium sp. HSC-61S13 TaxID=2910963 RepID=UPI0020A1FED1|nr:OmpA family protein [Flavobacterium sp. HSC-61S13]MCP1995099.1 outer membrane protein OmpA-like peptidoglycan-associated protein/tetratricopeptide (TPR) repeat protein [Flavobacterium sp. HSC-61S13]